MNWNSNCEKSASEVLLSTLKDYGYQEDCNCYPVKFPAQSQPRQPGLEYLMTPRPIFDNPYYVGSGKLRDKVAIITGGDSGLGRAVAIAFAKEGAKVVIVYYDEHEDAYETKRYIEDIGGTPLLLSGDIKDMNFSRRIVEETLRYFGKIDILINGSGVQYEQKSLLDITPEQFDETIKTNVYGMYYLTKEVLPHLCPGSSIINVTSVVAFDGEGELIDYVTSKGAIVGFTRSLATNLAEQNIRVNAVAPGPFWTPLQPACWSPDKIPSFGTDTPMKRAGQPFEIAPLFVYLASDDSSYVTGQVMHINGGRVKG